MIDYATIAAGATIATEDELPKPSPRQASEPNPFIDLVKAATKDGKRRDLPGRFSLTPYEGRKGACEAYTVMGKLHQAARSVGVQLQVRQFDREVDSCKITFKVVQ